MESAVEVSVETESAFESAVLVLAEQATAFESAVEVSTPTETARESAALASVAAEVAEDVAQPAATTGPRAIVGGSAELMDRDPRWGQAVADPNASGLTAWIDIKGYVRVWNAALGRAQGVPRAVAVIVATTDGYAASDPPVIVVAGITQSAALAAAQALVQRPELVRNATAVCLDAAGNVVCRGGSGRTPLEHRCPHCWSPPR